MRVTDKNEESEIALSSSANLRNAKFILSVVYEQNICQFSTFF